MIRYILIGICVLMFHNDETAIAWSESYSLTWSDFQGFPSVNSDAVAITASGITFSYSIKKTSVRVVSFDTQVDAHFYPEKSWYKPNHADNHILAHEQYHFNITELFARKFRQRIAQVKISQSLSENLDRIHQEINKELSEFQELYDAETNYSRNFEEQTKWQDRIDNALDNSTKFKLQK